MNGYERRSLSSFHATDETPVRPPEAGGGSRSGPPEAGTDDRREEERDGGAVRSSLDDGKSKSRGPESAENGRYDCRHVYSNMEMEAGDGETAGFRCGSWDCYCCGYRMQENLVEEIGRVTRQRPGMRRLLTLTLDPEKTPVGPGQQHRYIKQRWNALRTEINDRYPGFSYIWVVEEHEDGRPHLHVIVDRYLPQDQIRRMWDRLGGGRIVDIRQVEARNAANYIGKYLAKNKMHDLPDGTRRYGSSEDISLAVRSPESDDTRDWDLMMDDYLIVHDDGPLRRRATRQDLGIQKIWGGPVPPDGP